MARRRLAPPTTPPTAPQTAPETKSALPRIGPLPGAKSAPIAKVAGEAAAAGAEALREARARALADRAAARRLENAEAEGRVLLDIPIEDVISEHLARDRVSTRVFGPAPDEDMEALKASIRAHGQRTPAEVVLLPARAAEDADLDDPARRAERAAEAAPSYGLISGWRRLAALRALHDETGEPRFATLRALLRAPAEDVEALAGAYVAMVEENEIRLGLSHYERGRIAVLAAERGAFRDADAAVAGLFGAASKAKRSKIRSFVTVHEELGDELLHGAHLPERLGLRIAEALKAGKGEALRAGLASAEPRRTPEAEMRLLGDLLAELMEPDRKPKSGKAPQAEVSRAKPAVPLKRKGGEVSRAKREILPGLRMGVSGIVGRAGGQASLQFSGPGLTWETLEAVVAALDALGEKNGEG